MPFKSSAGGDALGQAYDAVRAVAGAIKREAQTLHDQCAAGDVEAWRIAQYCESLSNSRDRLAALAAIPGLGAYAQAQENDPAYDVAAEYATMRDAIDATRTWIVANFPKDASGYLQAFQFTAQAKLARRALTTAQTAGLRTTLQSLIATIA